MNWDRIKGNWKQIRGKFKQQWGKLTDDDLDRIEGREEELAGILQERYGMGREEAERQIRSFSSQLDEPLGYPRTGTEG
jgi:uncharacterized protein YjbJ (UPF0337 family)